MNSLGMPAWAEEAGVGPVTVIKHFLPIHLPESKLLEDVRMYFRSNPGKKSVLKLRSMNELPVFEFTARIKPDLYTIAYMCPQGEGFHILLNIEEILKPMFDQITYFSKFRGEYEFHIPSEARRKCPMLCGLISRMNQDLLGEVTLFQFSGTSHGIYLVYSDLDDFYRSIAEITAVIRRLLNICDKLGDEIATAGILDATVNRRIRDLCRVIRFICVNF